MTQFDDFLASQNLDWSRWRSLPAAKKALVGIDFKLSLNQRPRHSDLKDAGVPLIWDNHKIAQTRLAQKLKGCSLGLAEQKQDAEDADALKRWSAIKKKTGYIGDRSKIEPMFRHTSDDWKIPPRRP